MRTSRSPGGTGFVAKLAGSAIGLVLAATTGVVAASVISMGLISLPIMMRYGYDPRFAAGTIAASGTLAQIIPPSLVLIVLARRRLNEAPEGLRRVFEFTPTH